MPYDGDGNGSLFDFFFFGGGYKGIKAIFKMNPESPCDSYSDYFPGTQTLIFLCEESKLLKILLIFLVTAFLLQFQSGAEKFGALKIKLEEAHETIQLKRKEAKDHVERHGRAEWAICLSTRRVYKTVS